jgi:hypothetical protein
MKKNVKNTNMLLVYSVSKTGTGKFHLDFKVKDKVIADFVYYEVFGVYEIYLEKEKATGTKFSIF